MSDFNADNEKIDAALTALDEKSKFITGSYTGVGETAELTFDLGTKPQLVLVFVAFAIESTSYYQSLVVTDTFQYATRGGGTGMAAAPSLAALTDSGFVIQNNSTNAQYGLNRRGKEYYYLAIC
jgi:hypothetical protein